MTEKSTNYTAEMVARLLEVYKPEASQVERTEQVAALAKEMNRSTRSVVAKLTTLKVYVPKEYVTKKGAAPVKKEAMVRSIEAIVGVELDGLEKATKNTLNALFAALTPKEAEEVKPE